MAMIPGITIQAKNGEDVTIRTATPHDAAAFNYFIRESYLSNAFLVRRPEEYGTSVREERKRLKNYLLADDEIVLLAEHGGEMVALLTTRTDRRLRARHNIEFGIAVQSDWQGQGLGRALIGRLIQWAEDVPTLERLELHVLDGNDGALHLYRSLGFEEEGRRVAAIRQDDGAYVDDIIMCRRVDCGRQLDVAT